MQMPGRTYSPSSYGFGFNGMMKDEEVYGAGNAYTTEFRELDPRIGGRWWSTDPVVKAWESPYAGFANNPIYFKDPQGNTPGGTKEKKTTTDAGHGDQPKGKKWMDPGAVAGKKNEHKEKDYALKIEKEVDKWLTLYGVDNQRTRTGDTKTDGAQINWRWKMANENGSDVYVSIHLNNGDDNGVLVFYEDGTKNETESQKLGTEILDKMSNLTGLSVPDAALSSDKTHEGSLGVLKHFKGDAGVLIEVGGIASESNRTFITQHASDIGRQIAAGMYRYMYGKEPIVPTKELSITPIPLIVSPAAPIPFIAN